MEASRRQTRTARSSIALHPFSGGLRLEPHPVLDDSEPVLTKPPSCRWRDCHRQLRRKIVLHLSLRPRSSSESRGLLLFTLSLEACTLGCERCPAEKWPGYSLLPHLYQDVQKISSGTQRVNFCMTNGVLVLKVKAGPEVRPSEGVGWPSGAGFQPAGVSPRKENNPQAEARATDYVRGDRRCEASSRMASLCSNGNSTAERSKNRSPASAPKLRFASDGTASQE